MSLKVKIYLHFYISFLGFILLLLIDTTDYYLINKQYQPLSMYTKFEIYGSFHHKKAHILLTLEQVIIKISNFADFEQVIIKIRHFAELKQVIIKIVHFADFEQEQNSLGSNRIPRHFFF